MTNYFDNNALIMLHRHRFSSFSMFTNFAVISIPYFTKPIPNNQAILLSNMMFPTWWLFMTYQHHTIQRPLQQSMEAPCGPLEPIST